MKEFELGHTGDIGISKSKIFEMKRPKLEYAENCTLIHTYARKLEEYCDELEEALDKACEELENLSYVKGLGQVGMCYKEWKEWCMKDE